MLQLAGQDIMMFAVFKELMNLYKLHKLYDASCLVLHVLCCICRLYRFLCRQLCMHCLQVSSQSII